jgi:hypothetical protein
MVTLPTSAFMVRLRHLLRNSLLILTSAGNDVALYGYLQNNKTQSSYDVTLDGQPADSWPAVTNIVADIHGVLLVSTHLCQNARGSLILFTVSERQSDSWLTLCPDSDEWHGSQWACAGLCRCSDICQRVRK